MTEHPDIAFFGFFAQILPREEALYHPVVFIDFGLENSTDTVPVITDNCTVNTQNIHKISAGIDRKFAITHPLSVRVDIKFRTVIKPSIAVVTIFDIYTDFATYFFCLI